MKVRITKACISTMWYANMIGQELDVYKRRGWYGYGMTEERGKRVKNRRWIDPDDCEVLDERD